jgi:hypothetical protein
VAFRTCSALGWVDNLPDAGAPAHPATAANNIAATMQLAQLMAQEFRRDMRDITPAKVPGLWGIVLLPTSELNR